MLSLDCPACGRVASAEPTGRESEARCRACLHRFPYDLASPNGPNLASKTATPFDPEFEPSGQTKGVATASSSSARSMLIIGIVLVVLVAFWALTTTTISITTIEPINQYTPTAATEPSPPAVDARPSAAPAPLVDPSPFRATPFERR